MVFDLVLKAEATMALGLSKEGLRALGVQPNIGEFYLADSRVHPCLDTSDIVQWI